MRGSFQKDVSPISEVEMAITEIFFGTDKIFTRSYFLNTVRAIAAETFGTFVIVFVGCGCAINFGSSPDLVRIG